MYSDEARKVPWTHCGQTTTFPQKDVHCSLCRSTLCIDLCQINQTHLRGGRRIVQILTNETEWKRRPNQFDWMEKESAAKCLRWMLAEREKTCNTFGNIDEHFWHNHAKPIIIFIALVVGGGNALFGFFLLLPRFFCSLFSTNIHVFDSILMQWKLSPCVHLSSPCSPGDAHRAHHLQFYSTCVGTFIFM